MNSKIVIKYFGSIRDNLGISEEYLEIRDGWNVADAIDILNQKHKELVPRSRDFLIALNREYTDKSAILRNGDEIAIFPMVSGG
ncbi:MAG: MoaD/ThiS family protein [Candidatus Thermoplasmatota archaeon]|nr:MoaD/ThiS family protein [Candidatus Thermoplasmatota archaeon]